MDGRGRLAGRATPRHSPRAAPSRHHVTDVKVHPCTTNTPKAASLSPSGLALIGPGQPGAQGLHRAVLYAEIGVRQALGKQRACTRKVPGVRGQRLEGVRSGFAPGMACQGGPGPAGLAPARTPPTPALSRRGSSSENALLHPVLTSSNSSLRTFHVLWAKRSSSGSFLAAASTASSLSAIAPGRPHGPPGNGRKPSTRQFALQCYEKCLAERASRH